MINAEMILSRSVGNVFDCRFTTRLYLVSNRIGVNALKKEGTPSVW